VYAHGSDAHELVLAKREAGTVPDRQEVAIKKWAGSKAGRPRAIAVKN